MLHNGLLFVLGITALIAGAEALVYGASRIARSFGVSPLVIGLTIVAIGTTSPEIAVSVGSVLSGQPDLAVGNIVGSNIANVLVILGLTAVIAPLAVHVQVIRQEVPIMIGAALLFAVMVADGRLGRSDSILLALLIPVYMIYLIRQSRTESSETRQPYEDAMVREGRLEGRWILQLLLIAGGIALLVLGSQWLVSSSVEFARALGVSELVIGLTIIAAGTSMPEIATSVLAAIRGESDIAVGNVVGSNTFNVLGGLGIAGAVSPDGLPMAPAVMNFDIWVMMAATVACLPVFMAGRRIGRMKGLMFLGFYVAYVTYLILDASGHDALPRYSSIMISFVLPLTVVTLVAMVLRDQRRRSKSTN
jgi:cation:H+ antiporter